MDSFEEVAKAFFLNDRQTSVYVKYMRKRWANEEKEQCLTGYAHVWADRFRSDQAFYCSDQLGKQILREEMLKDYCAGCVNKYALLTNEKCPFGEWKMFDVSKHSGRNQHGFINICPNYQPEGVSNERN